MCLDLTVSKNVTTPCHTDDILPDLCVCVGGGGRLKTRDMSKYNYKYGMYYALEYNL